MRFIDLFSGMGGFRIGFEEAASNLGLKTDCVFTSEIKISAVKALRDNFKNTEIFGDIVKIKSESIPDFDFLLAGFPCQSFSQAGLRRGFLDTRGTLFFEIERVLRDKRPYGFLLENVEGLVRHEGGKTLNTIISSLEGLGYSVTWKVLDSQYFGLAQSRKRIYIVGVSGNPVSLEEFEISNSFFEDIRDKEAISENTPFYRKIVRYSDVNGLYGKSINDKRGGGNNIHSWNLGLRGEVSKQQRDLLGKILTERRRKVYALEVGIEWYDGMPLTKAAINRFFPDQNLSAVLDDLVRKGYLVREYPKRKIGKEGGGKRVFDKTKQEGYNIPTGKLSFEYSLLLDPVGVVPTLTATDAHTLGVIDEKGIRGLTISEGLKLFGYPSNYVLHMSRKKSFDLLGNTVCIPVIKAIAYRLINSYLRMKNDESDS